MFFSVLCRYVVVWVNHGYIYSAISLAFVIFLKSCRSLFLSQSCFMYSVFFDRTEIVFSAILSAVTMDFSDSIVSNDSRFGVMMFWC